MIIDMQDNFVLRRGRALLRQNGDASSAVLDEQIRAIELAKKSNLPIVVVEYLAYGPTNSRLREALKDYPKVKTIPKTTDGIFDSANTFKGELAAFLGKEKIKTLLMTGANGGACVRASIEGALAANCRVVAFERGIADFNYRSFIYPYKFQGRAMQDFQSNKGGCLNCNFRQVNAAADLAPFMVYSGGTAAPAKNLAPEPESFR